MLITEEVLLLLATRTGSASWGGTKQWAIITAALADLEAAGRITHSMGAIRKHTLSVRVLDPSPTGNVALDKLLSSLPQDRDIRLSSTVGRRRYRVFDELITDLERRRLISTQSTRRMWVIPATTYVAEAGASRSLHERLNPVAKRISGAPLHDALVVSIVAGAGHLPLAFPSISKSKKYSQRGKWQRSLAQATDFGAGLDQARREFATAITASSASAGAVASS